MGNKLTPSSKKANNTKKSEPSIFCELGSVISKLEQAKDDKFVNLLMKQIDRLEEFIPKSEGRKTELQGNWEVIRLLFLAREKSPESPFHYSVFPLELIHKILQFFVVPWREYREIDLKQHNKLDWIYSLLPTYSHDQKLMLLYSVQVYEDEKMHNLHQSKSFALFLKTLFMNPGTEIAYLAHAWLLYKADKEQTETRAVNKLNEGLKYYDAAEIYFLRAYFKKCTNDTESQISDYVAALDRGFTRPWLCWANMAVTYREAQLFAKALDAFTKSCKYQSVRGFYQRGLLKMEHLNDFPGAFEDFEQALKLNPNHISTLQDQAWLKALQGNTTESLEQLHQCQERFPNEIWFYSLASAIYALNGGSENSIKELSKGIKINPNESMLYSFRGAIYLSEERLSEAEKDFEDCLRLDPTDLTAIEGLKSIRNN